MDQCCYWVHLRRCVKSSRDQQNTSVCAKVAVSDPGDGFKKMGRQHGTWQMGMGEA